jgi:hypothetical protein
LFPSGQKKSPTGLEVRLAARVLYVVVAFMFDGIRKSPPERKAALQKKPGAGGLPPAPDGRAMIATE